MSEASGFKHVLATVAALFLLATEARAGDSYQFTMLDSLGGPRSYANAINNLGQVVGGAFLTGNATSHAVLWNGSSVTDLTPAAPYINSARGINDLGTIVGLSYGGYGPYSQVATVWQAGVTTILPTPGFIPEIDYSGASAINNSGTIVGGGTYGGRIWSIENGVVNTAATPGIGGSSINNAGAIAGSSLINDSWTAVTVDANGSWRQLMGLGSPSSAANSINDRGQVVGVAYLPPIGGFAYYHRAALWDGNTVTDLGVLTGLVDSAANAINNAGQVVGVSTPFAYSQGDGRATLWRDGKVIDLNTYWILPPLPLGGY